MAVVVEGGGACPVDGVGTFGRVGTSGRVGGVGTSGISLKGKN